MLGSVAAAVAVAVALAPGDVRCCGLVPALAFALAFASELTLPGVATARGRSGSSCGDRGWWWSPALALAGLALFGALFPFSLLVCSS